MSYLNAPATRLLATNCCCCGRSLVDATSVELGIGPECRGGNNGHISNDQRELCNKLTHTAAIAAQEGNIETVRSCANQVELIGLPELADKIRRRFVNAERQAKIIITQNGNTLSVQTPYKRSAGSDFTNAWRAIPGRRWFNGRNVIPETSKRELWELLKRFFPGQYGKGPSGVFKIPNEKKTESEAA